MAQDKAVFDILPTLIRFGVFHDMVNAIEIFDLDYFESRINRHKTLVPEDFCLHTLALKANPIRGVVQFAIKNGMGAEAASICEMIHALSMPKLVTVKVKLPFCFLTAIPNYSIPHC